MNGDMSCKPGLRCLLILQAQRPMQQMCESYRGRLNPDSS